MTTKITYKSLENQSWYDIATVTTGSPDNATAIAIANGASLSSPITAGAIIAIPDGLPTDVRTTNFFRAHPHPATAQFLLAGGKRASYSTLGDMAIGVNFVIHCNNK